MPTGMAMYGTGSLPLAEKAINVIAIIVATADGLSHATMRNIEGELDRILHSISGRLLE